MTHLINNATDHAATILALQDFNVSHPMLQEVVAGCLGHESFDSLIREEGNIGSSLHLKNAQLLILNLPMGATRAVGCLGAAEPYLTACLDGIEHEWHLCSPSEHDSKSVAFGPGPGLTVDSSITVFRGAQDLYERHAREIIPERLAVERGAEWAKGGVLELDPKIDAESAETLWSDGARWTICTNGIWVQDDHTPYKVEVLLTYRKAGRAGLVFEGCEFILGRAAQRAFLATFKPDAYVINQDSGLPKRPIVALIFDLKSDVVLGSAISVSGDYTEVMEEAIKDAFSEAGTSKFLNTIRPGESIEYVLDVDQKFDSARLNELVGRFDVSYKSPTTSKSATGGQVERLISRIYGFQPLIPPSAGRSKSKAVYTLEDLTRLVTLNITRHHETCGDRALSPMQRWNRRYAK
ncbi:hypothetical protein A262_03935 [Pseudomonas syringae pv. actinidiae ICMP 19073]|uniref:hypothetical protein n=1 Tax=Pseudomonas syringae TaxID=317 RepID=UPI000357AD3E|nr:hypothetical protein [Pseudomonas syringae]EPM63160.1 hypothetical protein A262_03935 [Pseudomonas syringae pv. actinidiae ICMP 19073]